MAFNILHIGDEHLADFPPFSRKAGYKEEILAKERDILDIAHEYKVDAVVRTGDIFHIKTPSRVSHGLVSELMDIWKKLKVPNYLVIGNHDLRNDSMESYPDQPIRDLISGGAAIAIPEGEQGIVISGKDKLKVRLSAIYGYGRPDSGDRERYKMARKDDEEVLVMGLHTSLFPEGYGFPKNVDYTTVNQVADHGPDLYLAGHIHDHFGIQRIKDTWFSMPGSLSRGSLPELKADRTIVVSLISIEKRGSYRIEEIPVKSAKPAVDVFNVPLEKLKAESGAIATPDAAVDKYVEYLQKTASGDIGWSLKDVIRFGRDNKSLADTSADYLLEVCEELEIN